MKTKAQKKKDAAFIAKVKSLCVVTKHSAPDQLSAIAKKWNVPETITNEHGGEAHLRQSFTCTSAELPKLERLDLDKMFEQVYALARQRVRRGSVTHFDLYVSSEDYEVFKESLESYGAKYAGTVQLNQPVVGIYEQLKRCT